MLAALSAHREMTDYMSRNKINPMKNLIVPFMQVRLFCFFSCKNNKPHEDAVVSNIEKKLELERLTKTGPDWLGNFMLTGPPESVPGPVVMNGNEMCHVACNMW